MRVCLQFVAAAGLSLALACGDDDAPAAEDAGVDAPDVGEPDAMVTPEDSGVSDAEPVDPYCITGEQRRGDGPFEPDRYCPGSEGCMDEGDDVLHAGAAAVPITPTFDDSVEVLTVDVNGNGQYEPVQGDEFEDKNSNGMFDAIWIGGFGAGRPASGVHDDQWARVVALRRNDVTIVVGALDTPIIFIDEVDKIRELVADLDVDYIALASTHCHNCRDNIGFWGPEDIQPGRDDAYNAFLREQTAEAIRQAVESLEPARIQYASFQLRDQPGGMLRYVSDSRDPVIIDDRVRLIRLIDAADATIATMVNWGSHAQYLGEGTLLSSDFPHFLRDGIENGTVDETGAAVPGIGGVAVFFSGSAGTQIGNERMNAQTWDGEPLERSGPATSEHVGRQVALFSLRALGQEGGSITDETAELGFRSTTYLVDVENRVFHTALLNDLFDRKMCGWDPEYPLVPGENEPDVHSESAIVDVGRAQLIMIPGELTPELGVGGYDGSFTPMGALIVDDTLPNPPSLALAPEGPYLADHARVELEYVHMVTLALDYTGYMVPTFDYELDRMSPYFEEAEGDHYEETRSLGPDTWAEVEQHLIELLTWQP